ncbi:MAG: FAD-dependent oxidoreductase [Nostocoides sp.]
MSEGLHVAIVGAGPSGFFAAGSLLGLAEIDVRVDMFDRLPTPWGLVRLGVAPDHPKIKSVSAVFEEIADDERFQFFGHVEIDRDISHEELLDRYDAVIYATGAQADRRLGIPGEDLPGCFPATEIVGWYNAHPDHHVSPIDVQTDRAVVVGNGNVALDIARVLMTPPERLARTDIADHALENLHTSTLREVVVLGRRGPAEAAFTTRELKELQELTGAHVVVEPAEALVAAPEQADRRVAKNLDVMSGFLTDPGEDAGSDRRRIVLRFLSSPVQIHGTQSVTRVTVGRNELREDELGRTVAVDTGQREELSTGLVVVATGYEATPVAGLSLDRATGSVANVEGRIAGRPREYVVGWAKRGPRGVIGATKKCAADTVALLVEDVRSGVIKRTRERSLPTPDWVRSRAPNMVTTSGWLAIDAAERAEGDAAGRPRVKLRTYDDLLRAALP